MGGMTPEEGGHSSSGDDRPRGASVLPFPPRFPAALLPVGDEGERAFASLWERAYDGLRRYAEAVTRDPDGAQDIVQSVLADLWLERFRGKEAPPGDLLPLAFQMVKRRVLNARRDRARYHMKLFTYLELWGERARRWMVPSAGFEHGELSDTLSAALADMPPRCRDVFLLKREAGMRYREIAASLGLSEHTVGSYMTRANMVLRQHAARAGFGPEARRRRVDAARRRRT